VISWLRRIFGSFHVCWCSKVSMDRFGFLGRFKVVKEEPIEEVTVSWGGNPVYPKRQTWHCLDCGKFHVWTVYQPEDVMTWDEFRTVKESDRE